MQLINNTTNTPVDYMYQNPYFGGAGYNNPAPQGFYSYGNVQPQPSSIGQIPILDDTIPEGLANSPTMQKQFEYQNDPAYQNYGNNSYYGNYGFRGVFSNFGNKYNPLAYYDEGYYNPYLSENFVSGMEYDYYETQGNHKAANLYYNQYNGLYGSVAQQQYAYQEYQQQLEIYEIGCRLNARYFGYDEDTASKENIEKEMERQYRKRMEYQNEENLLCKMTAIANNAANNAVYESPQRRSYIENWNRMYDENRQKYPEGYTLYQFFNEGIAENMYMDSLIFSAKMRDRELNRLYDRNAFKNYMEKLHPNSASYSSLSKRVPLTIDDMEVSLLRNNEINITLPESMKTGEDYQRREQFINSIVGHMKI